VPAFALAQEAIFHTARRQGLASAGEEPGDAELEARWRRHRPLVEFLAAQAEGCSWICEQDGQLVGYAEVARFGGIEELTGLMVSPSHHGRGVGRRLLDALVERADQAGLWTLQAGIFPENKASLRLHHGCGFRTVGLRERIGQLDGEWRDVVLMERRS
jgi:L-amino acid N-acyltransferase YncA